MIDESMASNAWGNPGMDGWMARGDVSKVKRQKTSGYGCGLLVFVVYMNVAPVSVHPILNWAQN